MAIIIIIILLLFIKLELGNIYSAIKELVGTIEKQESHKINIK